MNLIDELEKLGEPEVRKRLTNAVYGSERNPNYLSVQAWLRSKERASEEVCNEENLSISRKALEISEDANSIAKDANRIADRALSNSKTANIWAAIATLIAAIAMYMAYIKNP